MKEIATKDEYQDYHDAIFIVHHKRGRSWRSLAKYVCTNRPQLVEKAGWNLSIVDELPSNQLLGADLCNWAEKLLGIRPGELTNSEFEYE